MLSVPFADKTNIPVISTFIPDAKLEFHGDEVPTSCMPDTVVAIKGEITPLQQLKAGVVAKDIECGNGYELILKPTNGKPFCATHIAVVKLTNWWRTA